MFPMTYLGGQEELGEPPHIKYKHFIILVMIFETGGTTVRLLIAVWPAYFFLECSFG